MEITTGSRILGHVDGIEKIIENAEIVALPSYREGVPKILLEAAAMGKALLATDVPGCRELVIHEVTGLLAKARNVTSLAEMLERLLLDESLRNRLTLAAREKVMKEFDEKIVIKQTCDLYQSLFSARQA